VNQQCWLAKLCDADALSRELWEIEMIVTQQCKIYIAK